MGVALVQIGLLGHDAGHLAVCQSVGANHLVGRLCWTAAVGIGFFYWCDRHSRHHAYTNDPALDPDLAGFRPLVDGPALAGVGRGEPRLAAGFRIARPVLLLFVLAFEAADKAFEKGQRS